MSNKPFFYQNPFPLSHDDTEYYLLTKEHVSVAEFEGQEILKVEPQALTLLAQCNRRIQCIDPFTQVIDWHLGEILLKIEEVLPALGQGGACGDQ